MISNKKIIVTGGAGFLGRHIVNRLRNDNEVFVPRSREYDLRNSEAVGQMFSDFGKTDIVIHAAADIGGIGYSSTHPGTQFYCNTLINLNVVHMSYLNHVDKFVGIGSVCEYPANAPIPFVETDLWNGYPVITNDSYGLTKRMLLVQCNAYRKQYGFNSIHLLPVNLYGPYDDFDVKNSHVISALIRKIIDAKENHIPFVEVWGDGNESREFVYVDDAAKAIVLATELYDKEEPVNIGSGNEIRIFELVRLIGDILGYSGEFRYINNGLGGQRRRMLNVEKAKQEFGFKADTSLDFGLRETIRYYLRNRNNIQ